MYIVQRLMYFDNDILLLIFEIEIVMKCLLLGEVMDVLRAMKQMPVKRLV